MEQLRTGTKSRRKAGMLGACFLAVMIMVLVQALPALADIPGRRSPAGTVIPNPGTQEQELANITMPAPYNVFEFVVTCAGCHGGSIDQNAAHFSNWAGTNMASAMRDPVFRANQIGVNDALASLGFDGAGNICVRCHSPNAWMSGRTDNLLNGDARGSSVIHSPLLSTDDEGIQCEFCHRAIGNVTMKRPDLSQTDTVWNMLAGILDWPHAGNPYPLGPLAGMPYGDATLQINDGMTYGGKYSGSVFLSFSDLPLTGTYTGQTYGVYPAGFPNAGQAVTNPDGSIPIHYEVPIGPPLNPDGSPNYQAQSVSLEHPTFQGNFLQSSEFCGSCHDLTIPILNHGMPEQRTYTEWKFSSFSNPATFQYKRCQDCHMPTLKHEFSDTSKVTVNPDPLLSGYFPYAKDRNPDGGTSFHKFGGANRDLPMMMKLLYPEVDLEVIGAPTGNDTRIFPGMLSDRSTMYDRAMRNTEIALKDTLSLDISQPLTYNAGDGRWSLRVKVTNNTGHRIPSGYPDGRRFWIALTVKDQTGAVVYQSGYYDEATATLYNDASMTGLARARSAAIDSAQNSVMVYERATGSANPDGTYAIAPSLLNQKIVFDNRIPPMGYDKTAYFEAGTGFISYTGTDAAAVPFDDSNRYPNSVGFDEVTYSFDAPSDAVLSVRAEVYWQTHTREFMEHIRTHDTSNLRPEGPPSIFEPNYPLTPAYLSDNLSATTGTLFADMTALDGSPLADNWGGVAYATWLMTGKGAPYLLAAADSSVSALPDAPAAVTASHVTQVVDPVAGTTINDPFSLKIDWSPVAGADGYLLWVRYGTDVSVDAVTASWDKLAVLHGEANTSFLHEALNVAKTYQYKVQAFNAMGYGAETAAIMQVSAIDLPLPPENLKVLSTTSTSVTLSWYDPADNEVGFIIQRQDVPPSAPFATIATFPTPNGTAFGGVTWTDATALPGMTYNYQVAAYNANGMSTWSLPVQASTQGTPLPAANLTATAISGVQVDLAWTASVGIVTGYRIERSTSGGPWAVVGTAPSTSTSFSDTTVQPLTSYAYRVVAFNAAGDAPPSNVATVVTPDVPPAAPSDLAATAPLGVDALVNLIWTDNSNNETGFVLERSADPSFATVTALTPGLNATSFTDTTVAPKTTYYYRIKAVNGVSSSAYSNTVMVVTPGEIPQAPTNLRASVISTTSVTLSWTDTSVNESGFNIERSTDNGTTWTRIAQTAPNSTKYRNTGLTRRTTYQYRVQAYNADGVSEFSNTLTVTTR